MAEDWDAIKAEIAVAIASVGFAATLVRPGNNFGHEWEPVIGPSTEMEITVIDDRIKVRDKNGTLTGESMRVLTVSASGVVPLKSDSVVVRGVTHSIAEVMPLAPGGVDLLFDLYLAS